jgi:iron complex outermembrane recepter protein
VNASRRAALGTGVAALAAAWAFRPSHATEPKKRRLKIAAGTAPVALSELVRQTGMQVLFDFDAVRHFSTREVVGQLALEEALTTMFEGSGLTYEFINDRTIAVRPRRPHATASASQGQDPT